MQVLGWLAACRRRKLVCDKERSAQANHRGLFHLLFAVTLLVVACGRRRSCLHNLPQRLLGQCLAYAWGASELITATPPSPRYPSGNSQLPPPLPPPAAT